MRPPILSLIVLVVLLVLAVGCQSFNVSVSIGATPTPTVTPTPTLDLPRTATAQAQATETAAANATATAQANATATAQAQATAQANATITAQAQATSQANATATAQANATATARAQATANANATATAQAQATGAAVARVTATAQAIQAYIAALTQTGRKTYSKADGAIEAASGPYIASFVPNVNIYNFIAEAQFFNPADRTVHPWDYGFVFRYAAGDTRYQCRLIVNSSGIWGLVMPTQTKADSVETKVMASGTLRNFDVSTTGSNHLRVIAKDNVGYFFVNEQYVATFDLTGTFGMELWIGSAFSYNTSFPGLKVPFKNFNIYSLP